MATTDPKNLADPEAEQLEAGLVRLWEEYKLIQEKIDKIGEYQFKVKSWSATLLGALLFGGAATSRILLALPCAFVVAVVFHLSERRQRLLSQRLGRRAFAIERAFIEFPPILDEVKWKRIQRRIPALEFVPGIAAAIRGENAKPWDWQWIFGDWKAIWHWLVAHSDDVFYCAQYLLITGLFVAYGFHKMIELCLTK
jgi:hypothetical protein